MQVWILAYIFYIIFYPLYDALYGAPLTPIPPLGGCYVIGAVYERKGRNLRALWETNMEINRSPMAPHGPILSEDGATPIRMLAICLLGLFDIIFDYFLLKLESGHIYSSLVAALGADPCSKVGWEPHVCSLKSRHTCLKSGHTCLRGGFHA